MTGSLLHVVLSGCLADLSECLTRLCLRLPRSCAAKLLLPDCVVYVLYLTVSQYCQVIGMATGNSQPGTDRKGIDFKVHIQIPWNAPETNVTLDSPGVLSWTLFSSRCSGLVHLTPQRWDCSGVDSGQEGTGSGGLTMLYSWIWLMSLNVSCPLATLVSCDTNGRLRCSPVCQRNRWIMRSCVRTASVVSGGP